jgi:hypothetical protein
MTHAHSIVFEVIIVVPLALILALSACTRLWMTGWQSGSASFYGVRVDPEFERSYEASNIDTRYTHQVLWLTVALIGLVAASVPMLASINPPRWVPFEVLGLFVAHSLGMQGLYWRARQKVLPFAAALETTRTVDLASFVELSLAWRLGYWTAILLPLGLLAATALYLHAHFSLIPPPTNLRGGFGRIIPQPLPWTEGTAYGIYKPLVRSAFMNLTAILVAYAFNFRSRISEWGTDSKPRWTYRKLLMSRLVILQWLTTLHTVLDALRPLAGTEALPMSSSHFLLLSLLWSVLWSIISLLLLFTLYRKRPRGAADTAPDRSWKFGQYYVNPQDPALIVPARFGIGHTLNLGQPWAWAMTIIGAFAIASIWIGPNYISLPHLPTTLGHPRGAWPSSTATTDQGRLNDAIDRLKQRDGTAAEMIHQITQRNPGDLQILNTAAHGLALTKTDLPIARLYAQRAVAAKEQELHTLELGALTRDDISRERSLAQFWDTLGLVCERQGDVDCAHRYLLAAWTLSPRTLFATHLARLAEEQGDHAQAAAYLRQALGVPGSSGQKQNVERRLQDLGGNVPDAQHQYAPQPKEIPLAHFARHSQAFFVDLLFANAATGAKRPLPTLGHEQTSLSLSNQEKASIANSVPPFPFPDAGPERIIVRARVTCAQDQRSACSMRLSTPDEVREFYRSEPPSL